MGLFKKNRNEIYYPNDHKKHFREVIKFEGSPDDVIWRSPVEDFNNNSRLIVEEGYSALFFDKGKLLLTASEPGTYTLYTDNYAFKSRITNSLYGGVSPNNNVIYYVKNHVLLHEAVVDTPVYNYKYNYSTHIKYIRCDLEVTISDPGLLLQRISVADSLSLDAFTGRTRGLFTSILNSTFTEFISNWESEFSLVGPRLHDNTEVIISIMNRELTPYGLSVISMFIPAYSFVNDGKQDRIDHARITNRLDEERIQSQSNLIDKYGYNKYKAIRDADAEMERARNGNNININRK